MTSARISSLILALALLSTLGCREVPTSVEVRNGPSFRFRGSGRLASFTVSAPLPGHKIAAVCDTQIAPCAGRATPVWQIEATRGYFAGSSVNQLQIHYGDVPEGYTQIAPAGPQAPPALSSSLLYGFAAETTGAAGVAGIFHVQPSGAIELLNTDISCEKPKDGEGRSVYCDPDPYKEPTDLEKYVQEHKKAQ
jgi:hypothetical protein